MQHDDHLPHDRPTGGGGRHRREAPAGPRMRRAPSFRTAVTVSGVAAAVLTVACGAYVASLSPAGTTATRRVSSSAAVEQAATTAERAPGAAPAAAMEPALVVEQSVSKAARYVDQVVSLANAERREAGCSPLRTDRRLQSSAQAHANDMSARDYYGHDSPEGRNAGDRITAAGYTWAAWGENIHRGPKSPAEAMEGWMSSDGHRKNVLDCSFKDIGVGVKLTANGPWWVQNFATRR